MLTEDFSNKKCVDCDQFSEPYDEGLMLVGRDENWLEWEPVMHPEHGFIILYPRDGERKPHPECLATSSQIDLIAERPIMDWLCNHCFFKTSWANENMIDEATMEAEFGDFESEIEGYDEEIG